jgi:hypothetical protein
MMASAITISNGPGVGAQVPRTLQVCLANDRGKHPAKTARGSFSAQAA